MKYLGIVALVVLALYSGGCTLSRHQSPAPLDSVETVERYFTAISESDLAMIARLHSSRRRANMPRDYGENIKSIRLLKAHKVSNSRINLDYLKDRVRDVEVVQAQFDIEFYQERSMTNGRHCWNYVVVRESRDGPWLIDDWGHCLD